MILLSLICAATAAPQFARAPGLELAESPEAAWAAVARAFEESGGALPASAPPAIQLRAAALPAGHAGMSAPGVVALRAGGEALRHELAHQVLFWACPAAARDALFHEAFAMSAAGELSAFREGRYLSLRASMEALERSPNLDSRAARRALARILGETVEKGRALPRSIARRLGFCASASRWSATSAAELAEVDEPAPGEAAIVLSRHSGEVLLAEGDVRRALPFGSVLKPFVVAAGRDAPRLRPRPREPEWMCGREISAPMAVDEALLTSCNGYFLDWEQRAPREPFGAWGPLFVKLGMQRAPARMSEAIGLEPALALTPWAIAQAYRALAEARPEVIAILSRNAREGTLSRLPESPALEGVALKTGTVRDARARPRIGWIAAVDRDFVVVRMRGGLMPRSFARDVVELLQRARRIAGSSAASVQVLGLLPESAIEARCSGVGVGVDGGEPRLLDGWQPLREWTARGAAVCLAQPWRVRFPGAPDEGRDYAGVLALDPPREGEAAPGAPHSERQRRARRGSDYIFRTTLAQYAAGVVAAEAADLRGPARVALLRIAAHDEGFSRHPHRAVCDTTHCQAFRGTVALRPEDRAALAAPALPWKRWLQFSAGGAEAWSEARDKARVAEVLAPDFSALRFERGRAFFVRALGGADEVASVPCDLLRERLALPSCPRTARVEGEQIVFSGAGRGHGVGFDVAAAAQSPLDADALLRAAFGAPDGS